MRRQSKRLKRKRPILPKSMCNFLLAAFLYAPFYDTHANPLLSLPAGKKMTTTTTRKMTLLVKKTRVTLRARLKQAPKETKNLRMNLRSRKRRPSNPKRRRNRKLFQPRRKRRNPRKRPRSKLGTSRLQESPRSLEVAPQLVEGSNPH